MLTDKTLRALRPAVRPYKRSDEKGLYVIVRPDGAIWWRFKYRFGGVEKLVSLGTYPDTTLKRAREKRDEARRQLEAGVNPSAKRKAEMVAQADTFQAVADEYLGQLTIDASTIETTRRRLEVYVYPLIGGRPVHLIDAEELLGVLRRIEARGIRETAHRVRSACSRVFQFAVASGRASRDPAVDVRGGLAGGA